MSEPFPLKELQSKWERQDWRNGLNATDEPPQDQCLECGGYFLHLDRGVCSAECGAVHLLPEWIDR